MRFFSFSALSRLRSFSSLNAARLGAFSPARNFAFQKFNLKSKRNDIEEQGEEKEVAEDDDEVEAFAEDGAEENENFAEQDEIDEDEEDDDDLDEFEDPEMDKDFAESVDDDGNYRDPIESFDDQSLSAYRLHAKLEIRKARAVEEGRHLTQYELQADESPEEREAIDLHIEAAMDSLAEGETTFAAGEAPIDFVPDSRLEDIQVDVKSLIESSEQAAQASAVEEDEDGQPGDPSREDFMDDQPEQYEEDEEEGPMEEYEGNEDDMENENEENLENPEDSEDLTFEGPEDGEAQEFQESENPSEEFDQPEQDEEGQQPEESEDSEEIEESEENQAMEENQEADENQEIEENQEEENDENDHLVEENEENQDEENEEGEDGENSSEPRGPRVLTAEEIDAPLFIPPQIHKGTGDYAYPFIPVLRSRAEAASTSALHADLHFARVNATNRFLISEGLRFKLAQQRKPRNMFAVEFPQRKTMQRTALPIRDGKIFFRQPFNLPKTLNPQQLAALHPKQISLSNDYFSRVLNLIAHELNQSGVLSQYEKEKILKLSVRACRRAFDKMVRDKINGFYRILPGPHSNYAPSVKKYRRQQSLGAIDRMQKIQEIGRSLREQEERAAARAALATGNS